MATKTPKKRKVEKSQSASTLSLEIQGLRRAQMRFARVMRAQIQQGQLLTTALQDAIRAFKAAPHVEKITIPIEVPVLNERQLVDLADRVRLSEGA